ncbi:MAG: hypothetical protein IIV74_02245 [Alphaproteobacteria bacterium]|jgi:hypothetical protein|nr:hypothetical protein [Alphaproteobacteria bacterium]
MTDMIKKFNIAAQTLRQGRSVAAKVDIMKEFRMRDVFLDASENDGNGM